MSQPLPPNQKQAAVYIRPTGNRPRGAISLKRRKELVEVWSVKGADSIRIHPPPGSPQPPPPHHRRARRTSPASVETPACGLEGPRRTPHPPGSQDGAGPVISVQSSAIRLPDGDHPSGDRPPRAEGAPGDPTSPILTGARQDLEPAGGLRRGAPPTLHPPPFSRRHFLCFHSWEPGEWCWGPRPPCWCRSPRWSHRPRGCAWARHPAAASLSPRAWF